MVWIESHTSLPRHRKVKRLARGLGVDVPSALGYLHLLWYYATEFIPSGAINLKKHTPEDIAEGCFWKDEPSKFLEAMADAGFLDRVGPLEYHVHDWGEHNKQYKQRKYWAEQKRKQRSEDPEEPMSSNVQKCPEDSDKTNKTNKTDKTKKEPSPNSKDIEEGGRAVSSAPVQEQLGMGEVKFDADLPDLTAKENAALTLLTSIPGWPTSRDGNVLNWRMMMSVRAQAPKADPLAEARRFSSNATLDGGLTMRPRSAFLNWCRKAVQFAERDGRDVERVELGEGFPTIPLMDLDRWSEAIVAWDREQTMPTWAGFSETDRKLITSGKITLKILETVAT